MSMYLFRFLSPQGPHIGVETEGKRFDLTAASPLFKDMATWLAQPEPVAAVHAAVQVALTRRHFAIAEHFIMLAPIDAQEVWASGVTYRRSKDARMEESEKSANVYDHVYEAFRPELFFKSMPQRVVGPGMPIRIRRDSTWNVPEPELVLVMAANGKIVGTTVGNDMSSRSIEGENPLYLPQAKIYEGACAIGPVIELQTASPEWRLIQITIVREGSVVFSGEISTSQMRRTPEDLRTWLFRELSFPVGVFLFTGTGIVPPSDFTLAPGDIVRITIEGIGTLENPVTPLEKNS